MGWTFKKVNGEIKFFKDERMVPVRAQYKVTLQNWAKGRVTKAGEGMEYTNYLKFPMDWDEQDHWAYRCKHGVWYVYRVKMDNKQEVDRKLVGSTGETQYSNEAMLARFRDKMYKVQDEQMLHHSQSWSNKTYTAQVRWSDDYDGQSIIVLMMMKPKMTLDEIKNVILNEGGSVDKDLIIHAKAK